MSPGTSNGFQLRLLVRLSVSAVIIFLMPDVGLCNTNEVKRDKGVGSITVLVGFLFQHRIPDNAFSGQVVEYQVSATCDESLPHWLEFDQSTQTFSGLTQAADVGSKTFICVKAVGNNPPSAAKDVFSIDVAVGLTSSFSCPESDSVVLATIYVDVTLSELDKTEILRVLNSVGEAVNIPPENVRFTKLIGRYNPERNPVLFSGEGDAKEQQTEGSRIQFQVGCSGDSITEQNRHVQFLKQKAPTGELSRIIGYPVMDWTVHKGFPRGKAPSN